MAPTCMDKSQAGLEQVWVGGWTCAALGDSITPRGALVIFMSMVRRRWSLVSTAMTGKGLGGRVYFSGGIFRVL